jgi:2-oxoglutarate ferredoxin oxidoreductase subunit alpha
MPIHAVNDFVIRFANVNGSGSASANLLFARSIMRMGVSIAPRNIFPSNIQGLPTWYEVRVSEEGRLGARGGADILVAMNPQTFAQDIAAIDRGGYLVYDSTRPLPPSALRDDLTVIGMPLTEICAAEYADPKQRQLYKNIIYVGALAALLDIELAVMETLVGETFKGKERLLDANRRALRIGYDEAKARFACPLGIRVRRSSAVGDRILVEGNFAAGLGAVFGGATVCAWYPITPSTSLAEAFERNCARFRVDPATGKKNYAFVQAEDEIAAIGIAVGAGWNGARAFTTTSGPGISLMQEFLGLAYFAEVPVVLFDVQRGGPSTGMPTRTQQSDLLACAFASHGDTKHLLLIPDGPSEAFEFAASAFDLAERFQTPVFVMLDLDIGMNSHLTEAFRWDDSRHYDRGKVLSHDDLERVAEFSRYDDVDGDGIPYRTLPGEHPTLGAYFTRGTSRDRLARYTEEEAPYVENMERLLRKFETARSLLPRPVLKKASRPARAGVIYYGSTASAMHEAAELLAEQGFDIDLMRVRAFPLSAEIAEFVNAHHQVFVVEQNRDAQMRTLMASDLGIDPARLTSILHYGGTPITARFIVEDIAARIEKPVIRKRIEAVS